MTEAHHTLTETDQAYYDAYDEDITAGRVAPVRTTYRTAPGTRVSDTELDAILRGRPTLGHDRATGHGRSPRRQVRLPEATSAALDAYAAAHDTTPSAVIRDAVEKYLATA